MILSMPDVQPGDLGRGYDFFNANFLGTPFDGNTIPPAMHTLAATGATVSFFAQLVEDTAALTKLLDISAQAEFGFGAFKGSLSASYSSALDTSSYSLFIVGTVDVTLEKIGYSANDLARLRFAPEVLSWFKGPDQLSQFRQEFGDLFVSGYIRGGVLQFIVEIKTRSVHDRSNAMASIGGSGATWSASADFKLSIDRVGTGREVTARICQSGASWQFTNLTADLLFQAALAYPERAKADPVIRSIEAIPYNTLQDWPSTIWTYQPLLRLNDTVNSFLEWHREYREILSDTQFVKDNLAAFQNADAGTLDALHDDVEQQDEALVSAVSALVENPLDHLDVTPAKVCVDAKTFRARVPQWRLDLPGSAKDILAENPNAPDGDYDLWLHRDGTQPMTLLCRMGTNPREYLRLPANNWSMIMADTVGGDYPGYSGTTVKTAWNWIRLHLDTMEVDLFDTDGAVSSGGPVGPGKVMGAGFGLASQCGGDSADPATARVDLTRTLFSLDSAVSFGIISSSSDNGGLDEKTNKTAQYRAKGRCSGWGPLLGVRNALRLAYTGPEKPS
jgi:hypothetical protein